MVLLVLKYQILVVEMQELVNMEVFCGTYKTYLQTKSFGVMKMTQAREKYKGIFGMQQTQLLEECLVVLLTKLHW